MSSPSWMSLMRHVCLFPSLALFAAVAANAQSLSSESTSQLSPGESSSSVFQLVSDDDLSGASALHDAAAGLGAGSGAGQADHGGGHGLLSSLAFEAGGGFNAPTGDSSNDITWGGNFTVGAGLHFSRGVSLLAEYQLLDDKLPGNLIAETGANGGNAHIWSLTLNPVVDLFPKSANSVYVTGGGGFYRKVTNFTDPQLAEYCDYFYCETGYQNTVVGHFSAHPHIW